jgi:hypothetical protein
MPATVIAERIGWTRGLTVLKDRAARCGTRATMPQCRNRRQANHGGS